MHRKHDQYSISRFVSLLNSNPVLDADTQLLYGGRHGVRLLVLVCLRIFYAIYQLESEEPPSPKNAHVVSASHLLDYLVAGATILLEQLQTSYEHLKDIRAQGPMVRVLVRNLLAEPGARRYELPKDDVRMKSPSPPGNKPQAEVRSNFTVMFRTDARSRVLEPGERSSIVLCGVGFLGLTTVTGSTTSFCCSGCECGEDRWPRLPGCFRSRDSSSPQLSCQ